MSEQHRKLSAEEFLVQRKDCNMDVMVFTHEAHIRLAWNLNDKFEEDKAADEVVVMIKD